MGKQPPKIPCSVKDEQSLLGAVILDPSILPMIESLEVSDFYDAHHGVILLTLRRMSRDRQDIDLATLHSRLERDGKLKEAGGTAYIAALPDTCPTASYYKTYLDEILRTSALRKTIAASQRLIIAAMENPTDFNALTKTAEQPLAALRSNGQPEWRPFHYWTSKAVYTSLTHKEDGKSPLYETELPVDFIAGGLRQSSFNVIAGRPGTGKTALALFLAGVLGAEREVLFASLEMGGVSLAFRALAHKTGISSDDLYAGIYELEAIPIIKQAARTFDNSRITFRDGRMTLEELRAGVAQHPEARVLIVDYLQLLRPAARIFPREAEVAEISATLTALAAEQNLCVIALAQLNRAVDGRQDRRPRIGDLRESGAIEQDADQIWLLYRPKKYKVDAEDVLEIIIGKNRHGKEGIAKVKFSIVQGFESETSIYKTENEEEEKESE